ncbi:precorrin-3B C(17)-methyltransferase [bacterium]|nr:precorrin-3B C(17)-methyltransferase [bacterium]
MCIISWQECGINSKKTEIKWCDYSHSHGRLSIVGIGPGDMSLLCQRAREAIDGCEVIVGYKTYVSLLKELVNNKEIISSGMTEEIKRAKKAINKALEGKRVCVISSGDAGIYGMAGLILELLSEEEIGRLEIEIIPGISAASGCAGLLGAPLMHDFAVISLSDLLTDMALIEQRIELTAQADFVIVLYNPKSKKRIEPLKSAWNILMRHRNPQTPVGIVRNAYRENQEIEITTLKEMLSSEKVDMLTTIIIGNSKTYVKGKFMITPRGYNLKK